MKKLLFLLSLLVAQTVFAQFHEPVQFSVKENKLSDTEIEVVFTGTVEAGWHVYSTDIADGGPTRAELTLEKQKGVKPKGRLRATGKVKREMDELFGMELSFMEGTAKFAQRFTLTGSDYEVAGYLTYGACNDENCMPPTNVEFDFRGSTEKTGSTEGAENAEKKEIDIERATKTEDPLELQEDSASVVPSVSSASSGNSEALWTPVIDELKAFKQGGGALNGGAEATSGEASWLRIFLLGLLGGLAALLTPCVWPIIPMTVSFFLKRGQASNVENKEKSEGTENYAKAEGTEKKGKKQVTSNSRGVRDAIVYGVSIIVIYMALGLLVTLLFGASALNALSTNALFNIFFFLLLLLFGASFLGGFDIALPSSWSNAVDSKATKTTGLLSIFLMAFTLSLVSFSCTGPIIGFLLVEVASTGNIVGPAIGMFGFSLALALPFTLFALFPSWLKAAPKSGNWMNCIKVTLGFLELAFSLKFLSVADLAYGWHLLDREVFLSLWIILFALLGAYFIGWLRFPHDEDEYDEMGEVIQRPRTSVTRFFLALASLAFALYMVPGLWGAPCKAVSAFAPPVKTQDFVLGQKETLHFENYEEGMAYARQHHKPVFLDFTGYGCVNCRKMEAAVWTHPEVQQLMDDEFVVISLFVDEKTPLPEVETIEENGEQRKLRTIGDKWSYLQRYKFGANAQPFYVLVDNEGRPLTGSYTYNEDVPAYLQWLRDGLKNYTK
ncbi:MAG: thioredoxin family protein [Bacteroidaceae bacterium]|nr:thioredoxin family protein [Bacteroidaceae bacterium]